jgi:hypothetical protein
LHPAGLVGPRAKLALFNFGFEAENFDCWHLAGLGVPKLRHPRRPGQRGNYKVGQAC